MCLLSFADNRQFPEIHFRLFNFSCVPTLATIKTQLNGVELPFQASLNPLQPKIVYKYHFLMIEIFKQFFQIFPSHVLAQHIFAHHVFAHHVLAYWRSVPTSILWFMQDEVSPVTLDQAICQEVTSNISDQGEAILNLASISLTSLESATQRLLKPVRSVPSFLSITNSPFEANTDSQKSFNVIDLELFPRMVC